MKTSQWIVTSATIYLFSWTQVLKITTNSSFSELHRQDSIWVFIMFAESGIESMRPNNTPAGSRSSPAPGTEGGSSADLSSSLSQSTEDVSQDIVGCSASITNLTDSLNFSLEFLYFM